MFRTPKSEIRRTVVRSESQVSSASADKERGQQAEAGDAREPEVHQGEGHGVDRDRVAARGDPHLGVVVEARGEVRIVLVEYLRDDEPGVAVEVVLTMIRRIELAVRVVALVLTGGLEEERLVRDDAEPQGRVGR